MPAPMSGTGSENHSRGTHSGMPIVGRRSLGLHLLVPFPGLHIRTSLYPERSIPPRRSLSRLIRRQSLKYSPQGGDMSASYRTLLTNAMRRFSLIIVVRNRIVTSSSIGMTSLV